VKQQKVVDYKSKVKALAQRRADRYREAFGRSGESFTKRHFNLSTSDFIDYVRREKKYPPVIEPFTPFGERNIPDLSIAIWKQMEQHPVWREVLSEDPFAFLIELGRRFNKILSREEKE
jgi:hypothetical protein